MCFGISEICLGLQMGKLRKLLIELSAHHTIMAGYYWLTLFFFFFFFFSFFLFFSFIFSVFVFHFSHFFFCFLDKIRIISNFHLLKILLRVLTVKDFLKTYVALEHGSCY